MTTDQLNDRLLQFLDASPTPFHAVRAMASDLEQAGFQFLPESESWDLKPGNRYYAVRNGSSIIAFSLGQEPVVNSGFRMLGAHTDSPCLKLKPNPVAIKKGYLQLGVEIYGGVLMNPWFDRDLSLAGRISYRNRSGDICNGLINFTEPVAIIPSLAIHLDREANSKHPVNPQLHLSPILMQSDEKPIFDKLLLAQANKEIDDIESILSHELSFYDTQPACIAGIKGEFITSARLDNLLSCFTGVSSLINASDATSCLLVCNDHEEVGSISASGAQGPFLRSTLERIVTDRDDFHRCLSQSMLFSVDNSHGIHPNYADKHDANHGPLLNKGPVIKVNANQKYASNSETSAFFQHLCAESGVPWQSFVTRSDMACGSTIGPLTAAELGVRTLDIGVPTFAMHSIRETCGSLDPQYLLDVCTKFVNFQGTLGTPPSAI
jgi:aspartyl aminopeptidase